MNVIRKIALFLALSTASVVAQQGPSFGFEGQWVQLPNAKARLIASGDPMSGRILAGLEIQLDENWKTYWRFPGDSGIPPTLDWSAAQNVAATHLSFPAPQRFADEYGQSVGYKNQVVFPIQIELENIGQPTHLNLDIMLGICREVCIPVMEQVSLKLPPVFLATKAAKSILASAEESVPTQASETEKPEIRIETRANHTPLLTISVPSALGIRDVFVEGPETWFLTLPEKMSEPGPGGVEKWQLALDGTPVGVEPWGAPIRITLVGPTRSFEQEFTLTAPE